MKKTTHSLRKMKSGGEKITMITAYDYPTAKIFDSCGVDMLLVGDSLGNTVLGFDNTTRVTMEHMIHHIQAVSRATPNAMIVGDMPFLSYNTGVDDAVRNAGALIREGGCSAVKLEGGAEISNIVSAITSAGIPVVGHIGLMPQSIHQYGGYFIQGKDEASVTKLIEDALALESAGAFAVVLECMPKDAAKLVTEKVNIITIGIGAGPYCDGQVLVCHDLLGMGDGKIPSFVKKYANIRGEISSAVSRYINEVKEGSFPDHEHSF